MAPIDAHKLTDAFDVQGSTCKFHLPFRSKVHLKIFNSLNQEIQAINMLTKDCRKASFSLCTFFFYDLTLCIMKHIPGQAISFLTRKASDIIFQTM